MKKISFAFCVILMITFFNCKDKDNTPKKDLISNLDAQYEVLYNNIQINKSTKKFLPRNNVNGEIGYISSSDWTSGFYPGALWYLYELTHNEKWKSRALDYTERMDSIKYFTGNHDIGFMIECSFGNAKKSLKTSKYDEVFVQSAKTLAKRFSDSIGVIQSWNANNKWKYPVIIDNMMNLELLFHATRISGDSTYYNIAVRHADNTLKNHFREDYSTYHVLDYHPKTGEIINRNTHQGIADSSAWARGQAWGFYGYTVMYRETKNEVYLEQAKKIANFIKNHPNLPEDQIPYWDFDAKESDDTPRDTSAAAIIASALLELQNYVEPNLKTAYIDWANTIINSLKSEKYLSKVGANNGFLLQHSVGSLPHKMEIDSAINYADYYFLEALNRLEKIKKL